MLGYKPTQKSPHIVIDANQRRSWLDVREFWERRDLLFHLGLRDFSIRYKQSLLGAAWVVMQPLSMMIVYSFFMAVLGRGQFNGVPGPIGIYAGLLIWQFFANSLQRATQSLLGNSALIKKIYFPRLIVPISSVMGAVNDFMYALVAFVPILIGAHFVPMWDFTYMPTWNLLLLPAFLLMALIVALGVGITLATISVRFRDIDHLMPILVQAWMFMSPVLYPASFVLEHPSIPRVVKILYCLNPLAAPVEGFRWALIGQGQSYVMPLQYVLITFLISIAALYGSIHYFIHVEKTFADTL